MSNTNPPSAARGRALANIGGAPELLAAQRGPGSVTVTGAIECAAARDAAMVSPKCSSRSGTAGPRSLSRA